MRGYQRCGSSSWMRLIVVGSMRGNTPSVVVPLGPVPTRVIEGLCARDLVGSRRVLSGLPHPSGANAERIAYFLGRKDRSLLSNRTSASSLDASKVRIIERVQQMPLRQPRDHIRRQDWRPVVSGGPRKCRPWGLQVLAHTKVRGANGVRQLITTKFGPRVRVRRLDDSFLLEIIGGKMRQHSKLAAKRQRGSRELAFPCVVLHVATHRPRKCHPSTPAFLGTSVRSGRAPLLTATLPARPPRCRRSPHLTLTKRPSC
jgi:hypothetical protein